MFVIQESYPFPAFVSAGIGSRQAAGGVARRANGHMASV